MGCTDEFDIEECRKKRKSFLSKGTCSSTGLFNRDFEFYFLEPEYSDKVKNCSEIVAVLGKQLCRQLCYHGVISMDLVAFKAINDRFSPHVADLLLEKFCEKVKRWNEELISGVGFKDKYKLELFRHGGDEFQTFAFYKKPPSKWDLNTDRNGLIEPPEYRTRFNDLFQDYDKNVFINDVRSTFWVIRHNYESTKEDSIKDAVDSWETGTIPVPSEAHHARYMITGLRARVGADEKAANAESARGHSAGERGVINKEFKIYGKTLTQDRSDVGDDRSWLELTEYLIYVISKKVLQGKEGAVVSQEGQIGEEKGTGDTGAANRFKEKLGNTLKQDIKIISDVKWWEQDEYIFYAVPTEYDRKNEVLLRLKEKCVEARKSDEKEWKRNAYSGEFDTLLDCLEGIKHISWSDYADEIKRILAPLMISYEAQYLDGGLVELK